MPECTAPTYTQYASPSLIGAIAYKGHDPRDDPRWAESGALDQDTYGTWCRHICGIACLATYLHHRNGQAAPPLFALLDGVRDHGGYTVDEHGTIRGLYYDPLAAYARTEHQVNATVHRVLSMAGLLAQLDHGNMVMASVHKEIRQPDSDPPGTGGHLVLITGHPDGHVEFRNPSGHTPAARAATLPVERFARFYAQRGISLA